MKATEIGFGWIWETLGGVIPPPITLCSRVRSGTFTGWYATNWHFPSYALLLFPRSDTTFPFGAGFAIMPSPNLNFPYGFDVDEDVPV